MSRNEVKDNKEDGHYVDQKWLSDRLESYSNDCKVAKANDEDKPVLPDDLAKALVLMVDGMARRPNFSGYRVGGWLPEMKLDALETLVKYVDRYDPTKVGPSGAYSYVNRIIWQSFVRRIAKEKKQSKVKEVVYDTQLGNNLYQHLDSHDIDDAKFYSEHDPMDRH